jgi:hypothetical protein
MAGIPIVDVVEESINGDSPVVGHRPRVLMQGRKKSDSY